MRAFWRSLVAGVTLLLVACGGVAPTPSSSAPVEAAPSSSPSAPSTAPPAAAAPGPIRVGILEPLTGPDSVNGKDNQDGFNLYLEAVNSTMAGRKIEVHYADTEAKPDVGLTKAKQLVESDKVQLLMGISSTAVCYAIAGYVKQVQVPLIVSTNCGAQNLTTDSKYASPYLARITQVNTQIVNPGADWAFSQGYRKVDLITSDYGGGIEASDNFASSFIKRGGSIVQEQHPPLGVADIGPYVAQLNQQADLAAVFLPGTDSLHFMDVYADYAQKKLPVLDLFGQITNGTNVAQLKDKAVGVIGDYIYSEAIDTPENQAFLRAFHDKYPGRLVSPIAAQGYSAAQFLEAVLKKTNGHIEDRRTFLQALDSTTAQTAKGTVKLDQYHDVVQNLYIFQETKAGGAYGQKVLKTYNDVSQFWDWTPAQLSRLKIGQMKGKWAGMTRDQLDKLVSG